MALDRNILQQQIATLFADNNAQEITPQRLRDVFTNMLNAVILQSELVANGSGLRWLQLEAGVAAELMVNIVPIGGSIVLSCIGNRADVTILDATTINGIVNPITIMIRTGEAVLINRVTDFEIIAHALIPISYQ